MNGLRNAAVARRRVVMANRLPSPSTMRISAPVTITSRLLSSAVVSTTPRAPQLLDIQRRLYKIDGRAILARPLAASTVHRSLLHSSASLLQQTSPRRDPVKEAPKESEQSSTSGKPLETDSAETKAEETTKSESEQQPGEKQAGEEEASSKKEEEKKAPEPERPPHGDKTPWEVFMDTMRTEMKKDEWTESQKALSHSAHMFSESESVKRARAAYEAASSAATTTASKTLKKTGEVIGKGAAWTWETPVVKGVRASASATARAVDKGTKPLRETEAYKSVSKGVKEVIEDGSSSNYGGFLEKEERKRRRQLRAAATGQKGAEPMVEDPNAGTSVTVHKDAAWKESWRDFKDSSKFMQSLFSLKESYNESENPLISTARSISDRIAGFFSETEVARVIKKFREIDPSFQTEPFIRDMREYILPEVLDAYVKGDMETLKVWLSDAQFSIYEAITKQYSTAGLRSDGTILDIRGVDILTARMLEPGDIPIFVVTCRTQEVHVYRNIKSGELAAGMEDKVQLVTYVIGVTRVPEDVSNPETRGWRLIELHKSARDYF